MIINNFKHALEYFILFKFNGSIFNVLSKVLETKTKLKLECFKFSIIVIMFNLYVK